MSTAAPVLPAGASSRLGWDRRGLPLRWRLMLLVIVAVVPLLIFNLGYQYSEYREDVGDAGVKTVALARSITLLINQALDSRIAVLDTLATSRSAHIGDLDRLRTRADTIIEQESPGAVIELLTAEGKESSTRASRAARRHWCAETSIRCIEYLQPGLRWCPTSFLAGRRHTPSWRSMCRSRVTMAR